MAVTVKLVGSVKLLEAMEGGTNKAGKEWKSQSVVIECGTDAYPNPLKVTFWNGETANTMGLFPNDEVVVEAYVRGREWNDKYSVKLNGKSLTITKKAEPPPTEEDDADDAGEYDDLSSDPDDMPF